MNKAQLAVIGLVVFSFVVALYFYPVMPERMASHWDAQGVVKGYMPKAAGLFLMPALALGLALLFGLIPKIDPLGGIQKFRAHYDWFVAGVVGFLLYVYLLTIFWNIGYRFDMLRFLLPVLGLLFYGVGLVLGKAEPNWFFGIRTPWTLSSDIVWKETHRRGAFLFKLVGVLTVLGSFLEGHIILVVVPILGVSLYLVVFSYMEYRKVTKK